MTLPVNVGKGYVTGTFMDSSGTLAEGTVTFTPSPAKVLDATATPPTTILPQPVVVTLAEGTFLQQLVATDDDDLNPSGWTYTVSFRIKFGPLAVDVAPFSISLPTGGSDSPVDLTLVSPVASIDGTFYTRGMGVPDPTGGGDGETLVLVDGVPAWAPSDSLSLDARYLTQSGTDAAVAAKINDTTPSASRTAVSAVTVWQPTTTYAAGDVRRAPDGTSLVRNANGTSRATFDPTEQATWTPVATKSGTIERGSLDGQYLNSQAAPIAHAPALGLYFPEAAGAVGDGTTDDSAAIQSAINAAAAAGGGTIFFRKKYAIASTLNCSATKQVKLLGTTRARTTGSGLIWKGSDSSHAIQADNAEGFASEGLSYTCTSTTWAGRFINFVNNSALPQAFHINIIWNFFGGSDHSTSIHTGGGHNFEIKYNDFYQANIHIQGTDTSLSVPQAVQSCLVQRNWFEAKTVTAGIADPGFGWKIDNNCVERLSSGATGFVRLLNATPSMVGVTISDNWVGDTTAGGACIEVAVGPFSITGNTLNGGTGAAVKAVGAITQGGWITSNSVSLASTSVPVFDWGAFTHTPNTIYALGNMAPSGCPFDTGTRPVNLVWNGTKSTDTFLHLPSFKMMNNTFLRLRNAADTLEHVLYSATTDDVRLDSIADKAIAFRLAGTGSVATAGSFQVQPFNGATFLTRLQVDKSGAVVTGLRTTRARQTLAANGAVTIDPTAGEATITLQANATSTTISASAVDGVRLSITFIQDATGGRTYAWPANCLFAGGSAPSDTTANKRTTVRFHYDSVVSRWCEESRAVAVG